MKIETRDKITRIRLDLEETLYIELAPEGMNAPPKPKVIEFSIGQMSVADRVAMLLMLPHNTYRYGDRGFLIIDDPNLPESMTISGMNLRRIDQPVGGEND